MIAWRLHHKATTVSTNLDARDGAHGDVFTADYQTAGRGRLEHVWVSPPKKNLLMSVVLSVAGLVPEQVSTLPLVIGLAVVRAAGRFTGENRGSSPRLKWPNDVLIGDRKVAGILCERVDDRVVVGVGVNVKEQDFPPEISIGAVFLGAVSIGTVRDAVLEEIELAYEKWREGSFSAVYDEIVAIDWLKGRKVSVLQRDDDTEPIIGVSEGVRSDGSLDVGGVAVYAGEAHVLKEVATK